MDDVALPVPRPLRTFRALALVTLAAPFVVLLKLQLEHHDICEVPPVRALPLWLMIALPYVIALVALSLGHQRFARVVGAGWAVVMCFAFFQPLFLPTPADQGQPVPLPFVAFALLNAGLLIAALLSSTRGKVLQDVGLMFFSVVASLAYIYLMVSWFSGVVYARSPMRTNETFCIGSLRTINTVQVQYAAAFKDIGFSATLAALGPPENGRRPSAERADLIDSVLASGVKHNYRFTYTPGSRDAQGRVSSYTLQARPIKPGPGSCRSFFTDETGVIRHTKEQRPATADDPPIETPVRATPLPLGMR